MTVISSNRRTFVAGMAGAVAAPMIGGSAFAQAAPIKIAVGSDPVTSAFFVAQHEKLFQAENVNATVQIYTDGGEGMNALVAGQVDLATGADSTNMVRFSRAELRPLAIVYESGRYVKMVARKEITDGALIKKFGLVPGSISEYCARLAINKLSLKDVQIVKSGPPELPALLARGEIDAFFLWEPWPALSTDQGAKIFMTSGDVDYINTLWLTASASIVEKDKESLQKILRALAKAATIVQKEPERAAAAVKALTRIPEATTLRALKDMTTLVRDFNDTDIKSFDGIAQFLFDQKVTPALVPYKNYIQRGFYKA